MDSPLKIYSGANALLYTTPINIGCRRRVQLMTEDSITVKFSDKNRMVFHVGSRIGDFYVTEEQQGKYNANTDGYDYELKFSAYYWLWANKLLSYVMPGVTNASKETSFSLTASIDVHASIILRALNALGYKYNGSPFRVDTDDDFSTEAKYIQYANMSILGGIQAIAEAYECEWWVEGNAIHFGKCHSIGEYDFTVGDNVSAITPSNTSKKGNRLYVFGSDRNLPSNYRAVDDSDVVDAIVKRRLMLPAGTPYLQIADNIPDDQIVEEEVVFDKVYPRTQLTISNINTYTSQTEDGKSQTFYRINYGESFPFLKEYILPNEELHIVFESGDLNGMDFAVKFNPIGVGEKNDDGSINQTSQMFEIVVNEDYGRELPDEVLHPSKGDKFMLYGWDSTKMSDLGLIAAAEQELLTEGNKEVEERKKDLNTYTCPMIWDWCKEKVEDSDMPKLGSTVNLHFAFGDIGRKSRIIGFEHDLDIPYSNVTYTCGEKVSASRLKTLESKVEGLTHDGTKAKLQNSLDFLSKRYSDRTPYKLASDQGFEVGNYLPGVSGGMFGIDKTDNQSFADIFKLWVHGKAYFETLTIIEAATLAGKKYITPGGAIKCTKVEEIKNDAGVVTAYRCYFLSEQDGEKTETKIEAGDQAISEMFNAKAETTNKVSNHRYWRLVTAVNNDAYTDDAGNHYGYIDLSAADCEEDSAIPKEGDVIDQFGNRTDAIRQAAMVFSTVDPDAPSIKLLTGIGSGKTNAQHYSLVGKDIISQGYDHVKRCAYFKCYGDTYIGAPDKSTFINLDTETNQLDVKANIHIGSTYNNQTFEQWLESYGYTDDTEVEKLAYLKKALPQDIKVSGGLMLATLVSCGYTDAAGLRHTLAGMNGGWVDSLGGRTIGSWWGGPMVDLFDVNDIKKDLTAGSYATSLIRMDGSTYFANGNVGFKTDGGGWLAGDNITWDAAGAITFGNGIKINLGGGANSTLGGLARSIASVDLLLNKISNLFIPYIGTTAKNWSDITDISKITSIKVATSFWTDGFVSARGQSDNGGGSSGGSGKSYLADLLDVILTDPIPSGSVLIYNGSKWVNGKITMPDLTDYALESWVEANFVYTDGSNASSKLLPNLLSSLPSTATAIADNDTFAASVTGNDNLWVVRTMSELATYIQNKIDGTYVEVDDFNDYIETYISDSPMLDDKILQVVGDFGNFVTIDSVENKGAILAFGQSKVIATIGGVNITAALPQYIPTDTKNTAGATDTSDKIFLIGATAQTANPRTYSHDTAYVGADGCLYSGGAKVLTAHQSIYDLTIKKNGTTVGTFDPDGAAKTIDITDVASASTLASHTGNTAIHITAAERTKWNKVVTDLGAILGTDSDTIINKWEEVVAFLDTYTEADTLAGLLGNKADKATTLEGYGITDALKRNGSNATAEGVSVMLNKLTASLGKPQDTDFYICQYAGGSSANTTYYRRPTSALWAYIKDKTEALYQPKGNYLTAITKTQVEAVLTGDITSHTHSQYLTAHQSLADYYTKDEVNDMFVSNNSLDDYLDSFISDNPYLDDKIQAVVEANIPYVTLNTEQTITGAKTFLKDVVIANEYSFITTQPRKTSSQSYGGWAHDHFQVRDREGNPFINIGAYGTNADLKWIYIGPEAWNGNNNLRIYPGGMIWGQKFVKDGGTASQILMADGSVKALSDITGAYVSALGISGNYLTWTKNGVTNNITVPFAEKARIITSVRTAVITDVPGNDCARLYTNVLTTAEGLFPVSDNSNAILTLSRHPGNYYSQLGFSSDKNLYYRAFLNTAINTTEAWKKILDSGNYAAVLDDRYYTEDEIDTKLANGSVTKIGTATVGSGSRPIYLNAGVPTAVNYTYGNASTNIPISNGKVNVKLNADMLDGLHATEFKRTWNAQAGGTSHAGWIRIIKWNLQTANQFSPYPFILTLYRRYNTVQPESYTFALNFGWNSANIVQLNGHGNRIIEKLRISKSADGLTYYLEYYVKSNTGASANQVYCTISGYYADDGTMTTINEVSDGTATTVTEITTKNNSIVGALEGNASTATALQTTRTIWGQSFDGSASVSGALSNVTDINMSGKLRFANVYCNEDANNSIGFYHGAAGYAAVIHTGGVLASNNYADHTKVPSYGIYSKGAVKAAQFIKEGGTASQALMADGSVKALSDHYVTLDTPQTITAIKGINQWVHFVGAHPGTGGKALGIYWNEDDTRTASSGSMGICSLYNADSAGNITARNIYRLE